MVLMQRMTGVCGILWCVLSLAALAVLGTTNLSEPAMEAGDVDAIMTAMADNPAGSAAALYLFLASIVFAAGFGVGMARILAEEHQWIHLAGVAMTVGTVVFLIETMVSIGLVQAAAGAWVGSGPDKQILLEMPIRSLMQFRNNGAWLGSDLLAIAAILFGAATWRRPFPRWSSWIVIASGLLCVVGSLTPFFPMFGAVRQIGLTGFAAWAVIVGSMLLWHPRGREGPTTG